MRTDKRAVQHRIYVKYIMGLKIFILFIKLRRKDDRKDYEGSKKRE
jgi:hypothetical protein